MVYSSASFILFQFLAELKKERCVSCLTSFCRSEVYLHPMFPDNAVWNVSPSVLQHRAVFGYVWVVLRAGLWKGGRRDCSWGQIVAFVVWEERENLKRWEKVEKSRERRMRQSERRKWRQNSLVVIELYNNIAWLVLWLRVSWWMKLVIIGKIMVCCSL